MTSRRFSRLLLICVGAVLCLGGVLGFAPQARTMGQVPTATIAPGHGKPLVNLRNAQSLKIDYNGSADVVSALEAGASPTTLAVGDFDADGAPDLVAGYKTADGGVVTLERGNPDAFAPRDSKFYAAAMRGNVPATFVGTALAYAVPESPDFLAAGDFNHDGYQDLLVGTKGGGLYLLAGDGKGNLGSPQAVPLSGPVEALDVSTDGHVAISLEGAQVAILAPGVDGLRTIANYTAPALVTSLAWGSLGSGLDLAVGSGSSLMLIYAPLSQNPQTETVSLPFRIEALSIGDYIWDRESRNEIAALGSDGAVHILAHGTLDTRPLTAADIPGRRAALRNRSAETPNPMAMGPWTVAKTLANSSASLPGPASRTVFSSPRLAASRTHDVMMLDTGSNQVRLLDTSGETANASAVISFSSAPVAAVALPQKIDASRDLVVLTSSQVEPMTVTAGADPTYTVNTTADGDSIGACTSSSVTSVPTTLSLREAVCLASNNAPGTFVIDLPAGTYSLTSLESGELDAQTGAGGENLSIVGADEATTIIQQTDGVDRIIIQEYGLGGNSPLSISDLTMEGGVCTTNADPNSECNFGGGAILGGGESDGDSLSLTDVTMTDNQAGNSSEWNNGGAVFFEGPDFSITNSTFSDNKSGSGGAIYAEQGATSSEVPLPGTWMSTGSTFSTNTADGVGGGLIFVLAFSSTATPVSASVTGSTITGNTVTNSTNPGGGMGIYGDTFAISNSRIEGNTASAGGTGAFIESPDTPPATLTDNWWGCNLGPGTTGCDDILVAPGNSTEVSFTPASWLVLTISADSTSVDTGETTGLTASLNTDNLGATGLSAPDGTPVSFGATLGTISGASTTLTGGTGTATFNAGSTTGHGSGTATVDNQTVSIPINIEGATSTSASNETAAFSYSSQNVPMSALVTSTGGLVNVGSVTFSVFNGATQIGTSATSGVPVDGSASATYVLPGGTQAGTYDIQASYNPGEGNFTSSSDTSHTLDVIAANTSTAASSQTAPYSSSAQSVTLSAMVTSPAGTVNEGTVTFTVLNSSTPVGSATISGTVSGGNASVSYSLPAATPVGTYTIKAVFNGDSNLNTSSDSSQSLTVQAPALVATSVVVSGYPSPDYVGVANTGTVTVDDQNGNALTTYSGTATISSSDSAATIAINPIIITNGVGTFSLTFNTPGTNQSITAAINGLTSVPQTAIVVNTAPGYIVGTLTDDASGNAANCPAAPSVGSSCTLRDAITAADLTSGNITFNSGLSGTITLTSALPALTAQITIIGPGANVITVSGNNSSTVGTIFTVNPGATVSISGLTITGGDATSSGATNGKGGGIYNGGTLTVTSSTLSSNSASGSVVTDSAFLAETDSEGTRVCGVSGVVVVGSSNPDITATVVLAKDECTFVSYGGAPTSPVLDPSLLSTLIVQCSDSAIECGDSIPDGATSVTDGAAVISSSVTTSATVGGDGGGIFNAGILTVSNSTFSSNSSTPGTADGGGGIDNTGTLTLSYSTFSGNTSAASGGAILTSGPATVSDSTFSGNTATNDGGAIADAGGTTAVSNNIFSGNSAASGAGLYNAGTLNATNNVYYNNLDGGTTEDDCDNCTSNTSAISGNPNLSALGNYGGTTPTILLLPGSAAICGGSLTLIPAGVTTDQRGLPNTNSSYTNYTSGTACVDVGAVQTNYALSFTAEPPSTGAVPGTAMSPAPQVTVTESGVILTAGSASLMLEDTSADLTTLPTTASTVSGVATFSSLIFTNSASSDKLLATLPLDPTATPAPAISTLSDPFSVGMLTPTLSFVPSPNSQTYGTAIAAGSLDATASYNNTTVAGTFTYTTLVGGVQTTLVAGTTILPVGSYTITASFAPSSSNYGATSTTAGYQVTAAGVTLGFVPNPNSQTYGTAITAGSLDATATYNNTAVAGTFTYTTLVAGVQTTLVAGTTILPVGSYTITASFAPSSTNYSSGSTTAGYSVTSPAPTPTISFDPNPDSQSYGTPIESGSLDATAKYDGKKVAGTFAYTTLVSGVQTTLVAGTTILPAGRYTITAAFTPSSSSYSPASATASYTVTADSVTLGFAPNPKTQTYGTPIAAGSLDATATYNGSPVPGTFTYTTLVSGVTTTLTAGTTVLPIGTYTITASFTPSSTNYSGGSITAGYSVTSATSAPVAKISPTSINFGTLYLGSIVTQEVTITNTGNAAMNISNPLIAVVSGGDSSEFITVNHCPRSLAAGNSCVMTVTFIAGPFYNPQTATLTINDNAASSPQTVMLYATVIDPVAQLSAGNLSFGTVKVGKSSASQSVTLSNPGGTALTGITIGVGGADPGDFLATSNCGSSLASKKSCTITVTFQPTAKKSRTANVTISDNAQNSPQSILLSGTGN